MRSQRNLAEIPHGAERESLSEILSHAEGEGRMILPGIQALFGFQLIAVFNTGFAQLTPLERIIHLMALTCVALSATLAMAPAAFHRQAEPAGVSERFVHLTTRFLCYGLRFLQLGTCLDFYLIARITLRSVAGAAILASLLLGVMSYFWMIFPRMVRSRNAMSRS